MTLQILPDIKMMWYQSPGLNSVGISSKGKRVIRTPEGQREPHAAPAQPAAAVGKPHTNVLDAAEIDCTLLVEQNLVGICVILFDGTIAWSNDKFAELIGSTPDGIRRQSLMDVIPSYERERIRAHLNARAAGATGVNRYTTIAMQTDGSINPLVVHSCRVAFHGQPASLAFVFDTMDGESMHHDLAFAGLIVEQSPIVLFQALAQGGFPRVYVSNNVSRFGYTAEEVRSGLFRFPDYVHPDDRPGVVTGLRGVSESNTDVFEADYRVITRDGSVRWVHDRTVAIRDGGGEVRAYRGTLIDITERRQAELKLQRANRALRALSEVGSALVRAACEEDLLREICRVLVEVGDYKLAWIALVEDGGRKNVRLAAFAPPVYAPLAQLEATGDHFKFCSGSVARTLRTGQRQINSGLATHTTGEPLCEGCRGQGFGSRAAFPLNSGAGLLGSLVLAAAEPDAFDTEEITLLEKLADNTAYGISALRMHVKNDMLHQRLQRSMNETVGALVTALELRDPYTAGHQKNVARLAGSIAREMGLPESEIDGIMLAASLHDIGKLHVPVEILAKPGLLTVPEMRLVQDHVRAGYEILKGIDFPWPVADWVLQHHERLNGSGYPKGLKADAISLGAKIIAVADVFDSMVAHRPYRAAHGADDAVTELRRGRGTLYHPTTVDACIALARRCVVTHSPEKLATSPSSRRPQFVVSGSAAQGPGSPPRRLTLQQSAVIQLLAQGRSVKEIARELNLSIGTVKTHLSLAYSALGARNKVEAVLRATAMGAANGHDGPRC